MLRAILDAGYYRACLFSRKLRGVDYRFNPGHGRHMVGTRKRQSGRRWSVLTLGRWLAVFGLLTLVLLSLASRWIADRHGVRPSPVVDAVLLRQQLTEAADYADAYVCPISPGRIETIGDVERLAFEKGTLLARDQTELVYRGSAPGLVFHISYRLDRAVDPIYLHVATVVHYTSWQGALYFLFVEPIHRRGVPVLVSGMARG